MRQIAIIPLLISFLLLAAPAAAYSDLAEDFLLACRQLDTVFPPEDWSREDLRDAALEVLDTFEDDDGEGWTVYFCLITLGHTRYSEDVPRVLAYEETMPTAVIRSLRGFPDPEAIECLLRWIDAERSSRRELAIKGLMDIDFDELEDSDEWRERVLDELRAVRETEEFEGLVELIDEALLKVESSSEEAD